MRKRWVLSYPLSAQRILWPDWADAQAASLRWAHNIFCWFYHVAAHIFDDFLLKFKRKLNAKDCRVKWHFESFWLLCTCMHHHETRTWRMHTFSDLRNNAARSHRNFSNAQLMIEDDMMWRFVWVCRYENTFRGARIEPMLNSFIVFFFFFVLFFLHLSIAFLSPRLDLWWPEICQGR